MKRCQHPGPYGRCGHAVVDPRSRNDVKRDDLCYFHDKVTAGLFELPMPVHPHRGIEGSQVAGISDETVELLQSLHALGYTYEQCRRVLAVSQMRGRP